MALFVRPILLLGKDGSSSRRWCSRRRYLPPLRCIPCTRSGTGALWKLACRLCLLLLIFWGLFSLFFPALAGGLYSLFGALLFSGFIIFDAWQITERAATTTTSSRRWLLISTSSTYSCSSSACCRGTGTEPLRGVARSPRRPASPDGSPIIPLFTNDNDDAMGRAGRWVVFTRSGRQPRRPLCLPLWTPMSAAASSGREATH